MAQRGQGVGGLAALADRQHQGARVGHAAPVAVFACHLDLGRQTGQVFQPILGHAAAVVAGAASQNQHPVDLAEYLGSAGRSLAQPIEQIRPHRLDAFERVGQRARLLENLFLHVVPVRPQLGRPAVRLHRAHRALRRALRLAAALHNQVAARLQIDHIAFGQINKLVCDAGQRHHVAGQVLRIEPARLQATAQAQHQRRAGARAHQPLRFGRVQHRNRVGPVQARQRGAHRGQQVALVERIDQVRDHLGVGLAGKHIALRLQLGAQCLVVFDDAVVHQRHPRRAQCGLVTRDVAARAVAEVRVRVVQRRRPVRGPARVRNAGVGTQAVGLHLGLQLGHPRRAAAALQTRAALQRQPAGVVAPVFEPLQTLHQHGNDVVRRQRRHDATHIC